MESKDGHPYLIKHNNGSVYRGSGAQSIVIEYSDVGDVGGVAVDFQAKAERMGRRGLLQPCELIPDREARRQALARFARNVRLRGKRTAAWRKIPGMRAATRESGEISP